MKINNSGQIAEFIARLYFRIKGYSILKQNYKSALKIPAGEVDFIALKKQTIIFVEVKKRQSIEIARYAIVKKQQKRIINAAKLFIKQNPSYSNYNIRFDAVLIKFPFSIVHIKNAWQE
jgi:putative endonuclease